MDTSSEKKRLYNKVKWMIVPFVGMLYFFNCMDRVNVSFAALSMNKELGITAAVFGTVTSAFFLAYLIFQIPSNMLLKKVGASKLIPIIACAWGVITALGFFAQTPTQIIICRFLIGVVEAGFFPGIMFWFTLWLPSRERASAVAMFFVFATISGLIGSPLAGIIVQYAHWFGFSGWRWLFAIEGVIPAIFALFGFIIMKDSPEEAKWLTDSEKALIRKDLEDEKALTTVNSNKVGFIKVISNGVLWKCALIYMFVQVAVQTTGMWLPILLRGFDTSLSASVIGYIMIIPALVSAVATIIVGNHSDKTGERKYHAIVPMLILAASFLLILIPIGGLPFKIIMLAVYGCGAASWYGAYWTMPPAFISPELLAVGIALINSCSAFGGFFGNQLSGVIAGKFGNTGVFVFMAVVVLMSIILIFTLDFKKMSKVDKKSNITAK